MASESPRRSLNALAAATVLHDYVIDSELGSGGFSMVYLARHRLNSDWLFAIKEYFPRELVARDNDGASVHPVNWEAEDAFEDGLRRFRDEAQQLRRFRNEPYIVSCLNYFEANGTAYLVMDYDDGLPLSEFLRQREAAGHPFTEADLRAVVEPLLEGLEVVHRAGALHRDIKPGNVFVRRPDDITGRPAQPVLIDFGAAKQNYLARHSRSHAPYTPGYAAYEQISSEGDIGPWTDIYAVGALMWRMVAGGCPEDVRLFVTGGSEGTGGTGVWSPTPRAAEKRAYALHRGRSDPMVPAAELGAGRFSPNLLAAIDACLVLIPEHRVQSCKELRQPLEQLEVQDADSREEKPQPESVDGSVNSTATRPHEQRDDGNDPHGNRDAEGWKEIRRIWHTVIGRLKRYEQRRRLFPSWTEHPKHSETPLAKRGKATCWRAPTIRSLGIAAMILAVMSLGTTLYLRIPYTPEQEGPGWVRHPLGAAMRQHNSMLNLFVSAGEYFAFDEDPLFDVVEALLSDAYRTNQEDEVRILLHARSLPEYDYLKRKLSQEIGDRRTLRFAEWLGILAAIAAVISDPMVFLPVGALVLFGLRSGFLATPRGAMWGAGIGAFSCGGIVAAHETILHISQGLRTMDDSVASVLFGTLIGGLTLAGVGAIMSRRTHETVAAMQDASVRIGAICGLSAPVLQLVFERLGLANSLDPIETLSLAFSTFVIVALSYMLLGSIRFFAKRKHWIVWMITLGELHAHAIVSVDSDSVLEYTAAVIVFPLIWMPSAFILELVFRLFDNLDSPIMLRRFLQTVLLGLVGYLTWIVISNQPGGGSGGGF